MMLRASSLALFVLTSSLLTTAACSSSETPPGTTPTGDAKERTVAVESALSKPTGTVDAPSAKSTLVHSRSITDFQAFSDLVAMLPGVGSSDSCAPNGGVEGDLDVSCATDGGSGTIHYKLDTSADTQYIDATFSKACTPEGVCVTGSLALAVKSSASGAAVIGHLDVDVTTDGATVHAEWGYDLESGAQGQSAKLVLFEDRGSFVIDASVAGDSGSVSITGANGKFSCSFDGGGEQGTCSGSSEFTW